MFTRSLPAFRSGAAGTSTWLKTACVLTALISTRIAAAATAPAQPDESGFIRNWLVLDPVQLPALDDQTEVILKPVFERAYVKNQDTNPSPGDVAKLDGKSYNWKAEQSSSYDLDLGAVLDDRKKDRDNTLILGVVYVWAADDLKGIKLAIGSDDSSAWWLNGKEVIRAYDTRAVEQDSDVSPALTLHQGMNVLRFAVINGAGELGCCARFLDATGKPVTQLTLTTAPKQGN